MSRLPALIRTALVAGVLLEAAVLAGNGVNRWRMRNDAIESGLPLPGFEGYGLDFAKGPHRLATTCTIFRLVSRDCPFCSREEQQWQKMRRGIDSRGCRILILLPDLRQAPYYFRSSSVPEVIWVPLDWARAITLAITPTTIVEYRGRVVWAHQGGLDAAGFSSLRALIEGSPSG